MDPQPNMEFSETKETVVAADNDGKKDGNELADIEAAQQAFQCPPEYRQVDRGNPSSRSIMHSYGVRVVKASSEGKKRKCAADGLFFCMASKRCREDGTVLKLKGGSTTSATDHLAAIHGVTSKRSYQRSQLPKHVKIDAVAALRNQRLFREDKRRFLLVAYVKAYIIRGFLPFSLLDDEERRQWLEAALPEKDSFTSDALNTRAVKKTVVEIYDATKNAFKKIISEHIVDSPLPLLYLNVDLWTARSWSASKDKYLGLRVFFLTSEFTVKTFLLSIKLFKPGKEVTNERAGVLVQLWVEQVLREFGLTWADVAGAVTNSGSDVKFAFSDLPAVLREWCPPHFLSHSIIDGFGLSSAPAASKNRDARAVIMQVKKVMEHVNKSETAKSQFDDLREEKYGCPPTSGLRQAVAHRWVSGAVCLERFLVNFPELSAYFTTHFGENIPISSEKEVQEMYTMMKAIALVVEVCQSTTSLSGFAAMYRLVLLIQSDLNITKRLEIRDAGQYFKPLNRGWGHDHSTRPEPVYKEPDELTEVARKTRSLLREAVFKRFGQSRWGEKHGEESHLYDMMMALNPASRKLAYIGNLAPNKKTAEAVKRKVYSQLQARAQVVIKLERERKMSSGGGGGCARPPKQPKLAQLPSKDVVSERSDAGVMDIASDEERLDSDMEATIEEEAAEVITEWRNAKLSMRDRTISNGDELALFWRTKGRESFRVMSVVARSVLGAPGSAAVLERDFGEAGQLVSSKCGSLSHAFAEMPMFLRATYEHIPSEIPCLSSYEFEAAIPERLRDPRMRQELADMCVQEMEAAENLPCVELFAPAEGEEEEIDNTRGGEDVGGYVGECADPRISPQLSLGSA